MSADRDHAPSREHVVNMDLPLSRSDLMLPHQHPALQSLLAWLQNHGLDTDKDLLVSIRRTPFGR